MVYPYTAWLIRQLSFNLSQDSAWINAFHCVQNAPNTPKRR